MRSPLLDLPGAVPAPEDDLDVGVPWHFGDPFAEQRAAGRSAVVVDRSHRQVIAVSGAERLSWLHLVLSQHVTELPEGQGTEALVLDTHGRVDCHMLVAHVGAAGEDAAAEADAAGGVVYLDADADARATAALPPLAGQQGDGRQPLFEYLEAMRFWSQVDPRDVTADFAVLSVLGPNAVGILERLGFAPPENLGVHALPGGGFLRTVAFGPLFTADLIVPRESLVDWWTRLTDAGARPAGSLAYEALRVEALRPRVSLDTDEKTIPHEVGWIHSAAHVAKGCYRGQETVAKVHNVGKPPRRMLLLHLDGSVEVRPQMGDGVWFGDSRVGRVGSVVLHHELGPIALALVKRSTPTDMELTAGDTNPEDPSQNRAVAAAVDPDSIPPDTGEPPGRVAAQRLRRGV